MGLNCNQNELAAAIGRVQLGRLAEIVERRRELVARIADGLKSLAAVSLGEELPETEGVYWFLRVHVDTSRLSVDKDAFAAAVAAEGLPAESRYSEPASKRPWFRGRATYGRSGCPWSCPLYKGDVDAEYPCPQAEESLGSHFIIYFNEGYDERAADDIVAVLAKVESAFLK
jgi:dTDP-4-amino-4,6-dideoxygalactose transaminase